MKNRDLYMSRLLNYKDKRLIKVITGIRRSGKSSLLDLFENHLKQTGVNDKRIIHMNFESLRYDNVKDYKALYGYILEKVSGQERTYILLDEIQRVTEWEKCVNSLMVDCDVDIYITGSNAYLLSSELSTLLSGRYVTIRMLPLSFREYLNFNHNEINYDDNARGKTITESALRDAVYDKLFQEYLKFGSMPSITELDKTEEVIRPVLTDIYDAAVLKDVIYRNSLKDTALLESVVKFIIDNIGSIISPKRISDFLNSEGRRTTSETIDNYLRMLENAFIIYRAKRFDLKGRQYLKTLNKYYVVDTGIRNALLGYRDTDYGHILENIVYFELLRRFSNVSIGKQDSYEIDFIAESSDERKYYQVAATVLDEATLKRELRPLEAINDNYEKTVLTMDRSFVKTMNGIKIVNIIDFLLNE